MFSSQMSYKILPGCSGSTPGSNTSWMCRENLHRKNPDQVSELNRLFSVRRSRSSTPSFLRMSHLLTFSAQKPHRGNSFRPPVNLALYFTITHEPRDTWAGNLFPTWRKQSTIFRQRTTAADSEVLALILTASRSTANRSSACWRSSSDEPHHLPPWWSPTPSENVFYFFTFYQECVFSM